MIKNVTEITVLGQVMLNQPETKDRGVNLLLDLADQLLPQDVMVDSAKPGEDKSVIPPPPAPPAAKTPPPAPPAAKVPPAAKAPPAPPAAVMTAVELNDVLVAEYKRLGDRAPIDVALQALGAASVNDLDPSQYAALVTAVKAS